ncbi:uncharacterized protein K02A2.6 [Trichonephila clavipes]|nr:uncharacterized protein K02A2.6 [Trichonephila clavipes]
MTNLLLYYDIVFGEKCFQSTKNIHEMNVPENELVYIDSVNENETKCAMKNSADSNFKNVEMIDVNKVIEREHYQIPCTEDIISRLEGKKIFSDLEDGFWHVPLDEVSSEICAFNTPFGRYKFNKMPFGIVSAPEVFQKRNQKLFGDIEVVEIYFDDIIVAGCDEDSHDAIMSKVLERAKLLIIKFNPDKLQYRVLKVAVEPLNKSTMPPQCYRCQEFFHHSRFCARPPKCLKCSGGHLTSECTKSAKTPAKCANCSGPHPANFSGCPKNPINTKSNKNKPTKNVWQERAAARKEIKKQPTPSFAEVVKKRHEQQLSGCQKSHVTDGPDDVAVGTDAVLITN